MTYNLYIGSNNTTHKVELKKLQALLNELFDGYTIAHTLGAWKGITEQSVIVTITCQENYALQVAEKIKTALNQQAVALQQAPEMRFI